MMSQTGQQIITVIQILLNISRSKGSQVMKFGQLKQYKMINVIKHHTQNVAEKSVPDPLIKNQN